MGTAFRGRSGCSRGGVLAVVAVVCADDRADAQLGDERGQGGVGGVGRLVSQGTSVAGIEGAGAPAISGSPGSAGLPEPAGAQASSPDVAARLLAEILALDLGTLTPIRALTLLHELQMIAREAVPWTQWMAEIARARNGSETR